MLQILKDTFNLLTFRITREAMLNFDRQHLIFGLICTWLVGIGRYWDNPRAEFLQHLGIGSVVYIFVLSLLLWLVILPLKPKVWSYLRVLTFVSLVSPPAILYAIPVQFYFDLETTNSINALFLLIVSIWRVSLLIFFLKRFALLSNFSVFSAGFFPIVFIVFTLTILNLEKVVFDIMAGIVKGTPNDLAYEVLGWITFYSVITFPIVFICYIVAIALPKKTESENEKAN